MKLSHNNKPSRNEAYLKLLDLKERVPSEEYVIDLLINYFAPSVPKVPKTAFQWVAKAVADDRDIRKYLRYVHVLDGEMVATDGHRLHIAKTNLANGFYDPKTGLPAECDMKYPDIKRVTPTHGESVEPCDEWRCETKLIDKKPLIASDVGGCFFNNVYLFDAMADSKSDSLVLDPKGALKGENQFGTFVIMPMRW